jgi:hypothetical protein
MRCVKGPSTIRALYVALLSSSPFLSQAISFLRDTHPFWPVALKDYITPTDNVAPSQSEGSQTPAKAATTAKSGTEGGETSARPQAASTAVTEMKDAPMPMSRPSTAEAAPIAPTEGESTGRNETDKDTPSLPYLHAGIDKDEADGKILLAVLLEKKNDTSGWPGSTDIHFPSTP